MKKGWIVLAVLAVLYYFYLGDEAETPEYNVIELSFETEQGRSQHLTLAEKLPPGTPCQVKLMTPVGKNVKANCGRECRLTHSQCGLDLTPAMRRAFDGETLDMPYLSYEKGGLMKQQDFRLLYSGLERTEMEGACLDMREMVGNDLMLLIGGGTECVRLSLAD